MRNVDRIKNLEKELGRYRKKVSDQQQEINTLRRRLDEAMEGAMETNRALDAILARAAVKYGERARDEDTGKELGWRLTLPWFSVAGTLERYEVRARRDERAQEYIVGVMERETPGTKGDA